MSDEAIAQLSLPEIVSLLHRLAEEIETRAMQEEAMNFWKEEKHMNIKQIQCLLTYLGYNPGDIDGVDGVKTRNAVKAFQRQEELTVDGIAGTGTQAKLLDAVAAGRAYKPPKKVPAASQTTGTGDAAKYLQSDGCYHIPRGVDVQLTRNFRAKEIHCQGVGCCTESIISKRIMDLAQAIRDDLGEPLTIATSDGSGYRCPTHNAAVGGAGTSLHMTGNAVDIHYKDPAKLKAVVLRHLTDGEVGLYRWGCHVGCWDRGYVSQFNG